MSVRNDIVNLLVNINGNQAQDQLNELRKKAADTKLAMDGLRKGTEDYAAKKKELADINKEMADLKKQIGLTSLTQKELVQELNKLKALKGSVVPFTQEFHDLQRQIEAVESRLYDVRNGVQGFASFFSKISDQVKQFGTMAAAYLGFQFITSQFSSIINGGGKLSDQLADIRRVTGMTAEEVARLSTELGKLDTRTSTEALRNIAIVAGKLGVAKEDIYGFVSAMDHLVVALGDELGNADEIATQLGKIINVFDKGDGKVTGEKLTHIGNAIVDLANKGVASGPFIVDFTQRLGGLAKTANLSLDAVMGLGAGIEESGLKVESSSTAIIKVLGQIGTDVPKFAAIAGKSVEDFSKTLREKPIEALIQVSEGFTKGKDGFQQISQAFASAGEDGAKIVSTLGVVGAKADWFRGKITATGEALKANGEINEAFALKNETLGAILDKTGKEFNKLMSNSAVNGFLKSAAINLYEFIQWLKDLPNFIERNKVAFTAITGVVLTLASAKIALAYATMKSWGAFLAEYAVVVASDAIAKVYITTTKIFAFAKQVLTKEITVATAAQRVWNFVLNQNPLGWLIMLVTAATAAIQALSNKTKEYIGVQKLQHDIQSKTIENQAEEVGKIKTLFNVIKDTTASYESRNKALKELVALNPEYLNGITLENINTQKSVDTINTYLNALRDKARLQAITEINTQKMKEDMQLAQLQSNLETKLANNKKLLLEDLTEEEQKYVSKTRKNFASTASLTDYFTGNSAGKNALIAIKAARAKIKTELDETEKMVLKSNSKDATAPPPINNVIDNSLKARLAKLQKDKEDLEKDRLKLNAEDEKANMANLKKQENIQKQIDFLNGKKDKSGRKEESEYERLKKEFHAFQMEVAKVKRDNDINDQTADQKEIARIDKKYGDLLAKAQDYLLRVHHLKNGAGNSLADKAQNEIATLVKERVRELEDARQKSFVDSSGKEYDQALKDSETYFEGQKKLQAERFIAGEINEKTYQSNIAAIDTQAAGQQLQIAEDYSVVVKKAATDVTIFKANELKKQTADTIAAYKAQEAERKLLEQLHTDADEARIKRKLVINPEGTKGNDDAQKEMLAFEKQKAIGKLNFQKQEALKGLEAAKLDETAKAAGITQIDADFKAQQEEIEAEFQKRLHDMHMASIKKRLDTAVALISNVNNLINAIENRQLQQEVARNDKKKLALKRQLDSKLLSQEQYNLRVAQLDEDLDRKKKKLAFDQAKRQKAIDIVSAISSTALAVAGFLSAKPVGPWNIPMAIAAGAMGAIQIATIAAQPLPELGKGNWIRTGDKHSDASGGINAKIERDEAVMNAKTMTDPNSYTITGTAAQITSALNAKGGGVSWAPGAVVSMPKWRTERPAQLNANVAKVMAMGGIAYAASQTANKQPIADSGSSGNLGDPETATLLRQLIAEQQKTRDEMNEWQRELKVVFSMKEYDRQKDLYNNAKKQSSISR